MHPTEFKGTSGSVYQQYHKVVVFWGHEGHKRTTKTTNKMVKSSGSGFWFPSFFKEGTFDYVAKHVIERGWLIDRYLSASFT